MTKESKEKIVKMGRFIRTNKKKCYTLLVIFYVIMLIIACIAKMKLEITLIISNIILTIMTAFETISWKDERIIYNNKLLYVILSNQVLIYDCFLLIMLVIIVFMNNAEMSEIVKLIFTILYIIISIKLSKVISDYFSKKLSEE